MRANIGLISARNRLIRSITLAKSTDTPSGTSTPKSPASLTPAATRAALMIAFEGTHPTFRQSPPIKFLSTSATLAPNPAAPAAVTNPAVPAPTTTRL